ncbi:phage tail protein [Hymenobacter cavernae]|uniref:Tail Collar domain-containing protein n=1 Tax=Hymenobacter cavernae TaxID=2044852 RepID=A0ABQ1TGE3_9BACT|nr:tail fiber protein [Hymenobacter cavernae]GGE93947.1 tail Collar domain-containing protein [Hymenobacter cavernae]
MEPFIGEIRLFSLSFAPHGWAFCQGQTLLIAQNTALFSLLGTTYGGNGTSTFQLPDLRGRAVVGVGQGAGLSQYAPGEVAGAEAVTLDATQLPAHTHGVTATMPVSTSAGSTFNPASGYYASAGVEQYGAAANTATMASNLLSGTTVTAGGDQPHENRMPFLVLNYAIALGGVFPQRP